MFLSIDFLSKHILQEMQAAGNNYNIGRPRWLIRSSCGSKLRGTGFESRPGLMCVIEVVHIHAVLQTVQRHGVRSVTYGSVHYKVPLKSFDKSRVLFRLRSSVCRDIVMIVLKAT